MKKRGTSFRKDLIPRLYIFLDYLIPYTTFTLIVIFSSHKDISDHHHIHSSADISTAYVFLNTGLG